MLTKISMAGLVFITAAFTYYSATVKIVLNSDWEAGVGSGNCPGTDWVKVQTQDNVMNVVQLLVALLAIISIKHYTDDSGVIYGAPKNLKRESQEEKIEDLENFINE